MIDIKVIASGSSGNSYLIDDGQTKLLLDAGLSFKKIQEACGFRLSEVAGCLITHSHQDHCKAIAKLAERGMDIYLSGDTLQAVGLTGHRFKIVTPEQQFEIGSWVVMAFLLEHDVSNYGYLLASKATGDKLVYITDTAYCRYKFTGLTYIMVEANYDSETLKSNAADGVIPASLRGRIIQSHMSIDTALGLLAENDVSKVQQIYLLHLSNDNALADEFKRKVQRLTGAEVIVC